MLKSSPSLLGEGAHPNDGGGAGATLASLAPFHRFAVPLPVPGRIS